MCIIVDNDVGQTFFSSQRGDPYFPALDWVRRRGGKLVVGGRLWIKEYHGTQRANLVQSLEQAGRAIVYPASIVNAEEDAVKADCKSNKADCKSNDAHVIALARISGARVLCTKDGDLEADFKNRALVNSPPGRIYKNPSHFRLLQHQHGCPRTPPAH